MSKHSYKQTPGLHGREVIFTDRISLVGNPVSYRGRIIGTQTFEPTLLGILKGQKPQVRVAIETKDDVAVRDFRDVVPVDENVSKPRKEKK